MLQATGPVFLSNLYTVVAHGLPVASLASYSLCDACKYRHRRLIGPKAASWLAHLTKQEPATQSTLAGHLSHLDQLELSASGA